MNQNRDTDSEDGGSYDPYVNVHTGESLRTLIAEYAEQADELAEQVIVQALHWHKWQAGYAEFIKTFPEIIRLGSYRVADDLHAFQEDVHPWLKVNSGSGGHWEYATTSNPRQVTIDPAQRGWAWAQYEYLLGFKRTSDATMFKLAHHSGR